MNLIEVKANPFLLDRLDHSGRLGYYKDGYKGQNVVVCVIDSGVNEHTELIGKLIVGQSDTSDVGICHGTACASLIAGENIGIAPLVKILPYKRTDVYLESVVKGMQYARAWKGNNGEKVNIISLSISSQQNYSDIYKEVKACYDAGILIICSSGNTGINDITYPAAFGETLTVGSVDNKMSYSKFESYGQMLDVVQYGEHIIVADGTTKDQYKALDGTSFSTPITAGMLALYYSKYFDMFKEYPTPKEAKRFIMMNSIDLGVPKEDNYYGVGFATLDKNIPKRIEFKINDSNIKINGYSSPIDQPAFIAPSGRTVLPVRVLSESLGKQVFWDDANKIVTIYG